MAVTGVEIKEIHTMEQDRLGHLSDMLIQVVEDGASIGFLPPLSESEATAYWRGVIQSGVSVWIAEVDGLPVGSVQLHEAMKPNAQHRAEIAKLMVHPAYRRRGIAHELMLAAEQRARSIGRSLLILDTRAGDPSNVLYRSLGYTEAGRIPRYALSANGEYDGTVFYYKEL